MLIGLNEGAVVVVIGQHYSNVKETAKMARELSMAQEDLKTGREILANTLARIDALHKVSFVTTHIPFCTIHHVIISESVVCVCVCVFVETVSSNQGPCNSWTNNHFLSLVPLELMFESI